MNTANVAKAHPHNDVVSPSIVIATYTALFLYQLGISGGQKALT